MTRKPRCQSGTSDLDLQPTELGIGFRPLQQRDLHLREANSHGDQKL